MKVLLSGGGTGGHVYPAIAIANKIKEENPDAEILFVGTEKGIESEIVPKYGYELKTVTVQGFKRKIDLDNVKRVVKLFKGLEPVSYTHLDVYKRQAIGRWGNFINQEAHGGPTNLPWGIMVDGVKVHPTFLYESIWDLSLIHIL